MNGMASRRAQDSAGTRRRRIVSGSYLFTLQQAAIYGKSGSAPHPLRRTTSVLNESHRQRPPVRQRTLGINTTTRVTHPGCRLTARAAVDSAPMSSRSPKLASSPPTPQRLLQRRDALARANDTRTQRAQLKRDLKAGRRSIQELLLDPPAFLERARVLEMLLAVPKYGRVKANTVLTHYRISPNRTFGALSQRQRAELASMLRR